MRRLKALLTKTPPTQPPSATPTPPDDLEAMAEGAEVTAVPPEDEEGGSGSGPGHNPVSGSGGHNPAVVTPVVTDLKATLADPELTAEFRNFLRLKLDNNRSDDPEQRKMFEQWLDYVQLCERIFELPECEEHSKIPLVIEIGEKFLAKPPHGYNMALGSQINRQELINHCKNLADGSTDSADESLLRPGYEYIYGKLQQKHEIFRKTSRPPRTTLHALMCALS